MHTLSAKIFVMLYYWDCLAENFHLKFTSTCTLQVVTYMCIKELGMYTIKMYSRPKILYYKVCNNTAFNSWKEKQNFPDISRDIRIERYCIRFHNIANDWYSLGNRTINGAAVSFDNGTSHSHLYYRAKHSGSLTRHVFYSSKRYATRDWEEECVRRWKLLLFFGWCEQYCKLVGQS